MWHDSRNSSSSFQEVAFYNIINSTNNLYLNMEMSFPYLKSL